jgi:hypothetical protein
MIGIIIGLYITNYFEEKKLLKEKEIALEQVSNELSDNLSILEGYHQILAEKYEALNYLIGHLNDELELIIPKDSADHFVKKTTSIFTLEKYEDQDNDQVKIKGELELNIGSKLIARNLSHIVWDSYKQTNYMSVTAFDCLTDIEAIYSIQKEVNLLNADWRDYFFKGVFMIGLEEREDFMKLWNQLLMKQKILLKFYRLKSDIMGNCS